MTEKPENGISASTFGVAAKNQRQWREENREAIAAYNEHVKKNGVFGDGC